MGSHFQCQGSGHAEAGPTRGEPEGGVAGAGHDAQGGGGGGLAQVPGEAGVMAGQQPGQGVNIDKVVIVKVTPPLPPRAQEILELFLHLTAQGQPELFPTLAFRNTNQLPPCQYSNILEYGETREKGG